MFCTGTGLLPNPCSSWTYLCCRRQWNGWCSSQTLCLWMWSPQSDSLQTVSPQTLLISSLCGWTCSDAMRHTKTTEETKKTWTLTSIVFAARNQNGQKGLNSGQSKMATIDNDDGNIVLSKGALLSKLFTLNCPFCLFSFCKYHRS